MISKKLRGLTSTETFLVPHREFYTKAVVQPCDTSDYWFHETVVH